MSKTHHTRVEKAGRVLRAQAPTMSNVPPAEFYVDVEERQSRYDLNTRILATAVLCLVFVVALLVFLHLYARYVLRRRRREAFRTTTVSLFRLGAANAPGDEAPWPGLDPSAIAALPAFPYRRTVSTNNGNNDGSDVECTICLSVMEEGERVRLLPSCRHVFHVRCIDTWLSCTSTCPVCRAVVEPAPKAIAVEMGESSASQSGVSELSGAGGGAGNASELKSGSMSSLFSSSFRRMYMLRSAERRTQGDGMEDLERQEQNFPNN